MLYVSEIRTTNYIGIRPARKQHSNLFNVEFHNDLLIIVLHSFCCFCTHVNFVLEKKNKNFIFIWQLDKWPNDRTSDKLCTLFSTRVCLLFSWNLNWICLLLYFFLTVFSSFGTVWHIKCNSLRFFHCVWWAMTKKTNNCTHRSSGTRS